MLTDYVAPTADIWDVSPDPRTGAVPTITIAFTEPVFGVDLSDFSLDRGTSRVTWPAETTLTTIDHKTYYLGNLQSETGAWTTDVYKITLAAKGSGITDVAGNALLQDATDTWSLTYRSTGPHINSIYPVTPDPVTGIVSYVDFFSAGEFNTSTFTFQDMELTRNGMPLQLDTSVTITYLGSGKYRIGGLSTFTSLNGRYFLTVFGDGLYDTSNRQGSNSASATWTKGSVAAGIVHGTLWQDADADGTRDAGEAGLNGWTVYADLNNDGVHGVGTEPSATTDSNGNYTLSNLSEGAYTIRQVLPAGWKQTGPQRNGTLYFSEESNSNGLYVLNTQTGAATPIGYTGVGGGNVGLAESDQPGILFGSLYWAIDTIPTTGTGPITQLSGDHATGLAYDYEADILYGAIYEQVFAINPTTGERLTNLPNSPYAIDGLEYTEGKLWALGLSGSLMSFDFQTQAWSIVGFSGLYGNSYGLAYDSFKKTLYAVQRNDTKLYRIDMQTAQKTVVGDTGISNGGGLAMVGQRPVSYAVTVGSGQTVNEINFGNQQQTSPTPGAADLLAHSDTGWSPTDNVTQRDNSAPAKSLSFAVSGTVAGATVNLYADGALVGSATANGSTTTVTTYGTSDLADGSHSFTARQTEPGKAQSADSAVLVVTVDTLPPPVPPGPQLAPASDSGIQGDGLTFDNTPTFNVLATPYFRLYRDGILVSGEYETGASYTSAVQADGSYVYSVAAVDVAGNESSHSPTLDVRIDTEVPIVLGVSSTAANGAYTAGAEIPVTVEFTKVVTVTGTPHLTLETGTFNRVVDYTSGSGTTTLMFNYTVQAGDSSGDLDYVSTTALALNGGTIRDAASNNATLTLAEPGEAGSLGASKDLAIYTPPSLSISVTDAIKPEGTSANGTPFVFEVIRDGDKSGVTTVRYTVAAGGTSLVTGADFVGGTLPSDKITFAAGEDTKLITILVAADTTVELDETFTVTLSEASGGAALDVDSATGTIQNDDTSLVSISSTSVTEQNVPVHLDFTVTLTNPVDVPVTVQFTTADGTAVAPDDYVAQSSQLVTIPANTTSVTHPVQIVGDDQWELEETLKGAISNLNASGRAVSLSQVKSATGFITNDDPPPVEIEIHLYQDIGGVPGALIADDQVRVGDTFFVEIVAGDVRDAAAGLVSLYLDIRWNVAVLREIDDPFNPADPSSSLVTTKFPIERSGTLDNAQGTIDELSGGSLPAVPIGEALGIGVLERFSLLHFQALAASASSLFVVTLGEGGGSLGDEIPEIDATIEQQTIVVNPAATEISAAPALLSDGSAGEDKFTVTVVFGAPMDIGVTPTLEFSPDVTSGSATLTFASGTWSAADTTYTATYDVADRNVDVAGVTIDVTGARYASGSPIEDYVPEVEFAIDTRNPTVAASVPILAGPTDADSLTFNVTLDSWVSNLTSDDFELARTGTADGLIASVSAATGNSFTVSVENIVGDGTLRLDLKGKTDVQDAAGNVAEPYNSGEVVTIQNAVTTVTLEATPSGFVAHFPRSLDTSVLNLYDVQSLDYGPADLTVVGDQVGTVKGSLIYDELARTATFIRTGGPLAGDTYTVTLRSADNGFKYSDGELIDGDGDGAPGGNLARRMTVPEITGPVLSIPDFTRGPDQPANVPATGSDIPVSISDGNGILGISFAIEFNPALLSITQVTRASGLPTDWLVLSEPAGSGRINVLLYGTESLPAGPVNLAQIHASVPADAGYGLAQVIDLSDLQINEVASGIADDAVHTVAYFGDGSGNFNYGALDASYAARVAIGRDSGFRAFPMKDPVLIADINGNGSLGALDASYIAQKAIGRAVPQIPSLPATVPPIQQGGIDPVVTLPTITDAHPGDAITKPILVDDAGGLMALQFTIRYSTGLVDVAPADIVAGSLLNGWTLIKDIFDAEGRIEILAYGVDPLPAGGGELVQVTYHIPATASDGVSPLNLAGFLNEGELVMTPVDGSITVTTTASSPTVSITRYDPVSEWTNGDTVTFAVVFDKGVQNVDPSDFVPDMDGTVAAGILTVADAGDGDHSTYHVSISGIAGDGNLGLAFATGQDIEDLVGHAFDPDSGITTHQMYCIDNTEPAGNLDVTTPTNDATPLITVTPTDSGSGIVSDGSVVLDVDLNNDGDYADPGERDYTTQTLTDGAVTFELSPALAQGSYRLRARFSDLAGNEGSAEWAPLIVDLSLPQVAVEFPAANGAYHAAGWTDAITGTAADGGLAGLQQVDVSVRRLADGRYWGGSAFDQASEFFLAANGTNAWSLSFPDSQLTDGASYVVGVRATDLAGNTAAGSSVAFAYDTTPPQVTVQSLTTSDTAPAITGTVSDGTLQVLVHGKTYSAGDGNLVVNGTNWTLQIPASDSLTPGIYDVTASATDAAGNVGTDGTAGELVIQAARTTLAVTALTRTHTGFVAEFNRALQAAGLNVYDQGNLLGPADVTLVGANTGPVTGSVILAADLRSLTFLKTAGMLAPDTYTVTLRSGPAAIRDAAGELLDGDGDGTAGGDYVATFVVAAPPADAITVSLPNMTRGPGQPLNLPADNLTAGLPLTLSNGFGLSGLDLEFHYDTRLLEITEFVLDSDVAARQGIAQLTFPSPGVARLTVDTSGSLGAAPGLLRLGSFVAAVPEHAAYGGQQVLDIRNLHVYDNGPRLLEVPSLDDDAVHVAAFFGDASGDGWYNSPDATLTRRIIGQINTGLVAYPLTDPVLILDITHDGSIQSNDTTSIRRAIGLVPVPNIPPLPAAPAAPRAAAADLPLTGPREQAAAAGETIGINNDQACTALDALLVVNDLDAQTGVDVGLGLHTAAGEALVDDARDEWLPDLDAELSPLDSVLDDLADDIATAWR